MLLDVLRYLRQEWSVYLRTGKIVNMESHFHLKLKALDTQNICWHKSLFCNKQLGAFDSIKHCEKQIPLK